jgi:hypothetical protein
MMVPVVRGEILIGGIWHLEQFALKTSSPVVFVAPCFAATGFCWLCRFAECATDTVPTAIAAVTIT